MYWLGRDSARCRYRAMVRRCRKGSARTARVAWAVWIALTARAALAEWAALTEWVALTATLTAITADGNCAAGSQSRRPQPNDLLVHRGDRSADDDLITIAGSRECTEDSGDGFKTVLVDMAGIGQFEVQSRGAMGQAGNVRGAADGIDDARRNHCRRCVRCVRHGSSLLPYATVFHYRRWVPQKHGNAGKASRNGNYALRCSAMVSRHNVPR